MPSLFAAIPLLFAENAPAANPNGSAPGLWLQHERTTIVLLPGPPREMKPMLDTLIRERLAGQAAAPSV